jgi:hypothetical protein
MVVGGYAVVPGSSSRKSRRLSVYGGGASGYTAFYSSTGYGVTTGAARCAIGFGLLAKPPSANFSNKSNGFSDGKSRKSPRSIRPPLYDGALAAPKSSAMFYSNSISCTLT